MPCKCFFLIHLKTSESHWGRNGFKMLLIRIVLPSFKNKSLEDPLNSQAGFIFLLLFGKINALGVKLQFL